MAEFLNRLLENSSFPVFSAFVLGLMTAISPCPLATNITAIGYIGKNIENKNKVFLDGLVYTLGRAISYMLIAVIILLGADRFKLSGIFQKYGERFIGPLLLIIGLFMLDILKINFPQFSRLTKKLQSKNSYSYWNVLLLGLVFAMTFCPYSGVLYFGILIPMALANANGMILPLFFAIATGIPVIIFAWLLAFGIGSVGNLYNKIKIFELWFRRIVAIIFIGIGIYYLKIHFL